MHRQVRGRKNALCGLITFACRHFIRWHWSVNQFSEAPRWPGRLRQLSGPLRGPGELSGRWVRVRFPAASPWEEKHDPQRHRVAFPRLGPAGHAPRGLPSQAGHVRPRLARSASGICPRALHRLAAEICVNDPIVEHQLRVYHAGPFLTPLHRLEPARDVLWSGWSGSAPRQAISS